MRQVALFPERELVIEVDIGILRKKPLALQLHERCRDEEEFSRDLEIEMFELFDFDEIRIDDARQ